MLVNSEDLIAKPGTASYLSTPPSDHNSEETLFSSRKRLFSCIAGAWVNAGAVQMSNANKEE